MQRQVKQHPSQRQGTDAHTVCAHERRDVAPSDKRRTQVQLRVARLPEVLEELDAVLLGGSNDEDGVEMVGGRRLRTT